VWHPNLETPNNVQIQQIKITAEKIAPIEQKITLKPTTQTGKLPENDGGNSLY
jgi:hypothetical protein